ncbi:hypothetical protein J5Y04_31370 [Kitasatospora sp. RG8]|uniref:hypothetical protein n=1 Tax=Kitasatospora sp. RG8 TaxID=2820815 RepID=UPI001ADEF929|nr:hypothetical protein [Kitasatospora sp. RG8]MBP0454008.1 hypothetical protein [Kitasatospora sp. RG8]
MRTALSPQSTAVVTRAYERLAGLCGPTVQLEAALLLDDLYAATAKHGHERTSTDLGWLVTAATEATSSKHRHRGPNRSVAELQQLTKALTTGLTEAGLVLTLSAGRTGAAVEPLSGGPVWGGNGRTGLAVGIYLNGGWDVMVNQPQSRVFSLYAPATEAGAREVAEIVHGNLSGDRPDPFRGR